MHELIKGGSLMCTGGSQKCIDGSHGVKYSRSSFFPLKIHFKGRQLPAVRGFFQISFCFCNAEKRNLATGGAENFSFHSLQHRILKFAKRGRQPFSGFTYLLRVSLRFCQMDNKKSSKSFSDLLLHVPLRGGWIFSFYAIG